MERRSFVGYFVVVDNASEEVCWYIVVDYFVEAMES